MNTTTHMSMPHAGGMHAKAHKGHGALEKLIDTAKPTHEAIKSGAWSDPRTWANGRIPDKGASVLIGHGMTVTYDQVSDERLKTIAVRGNLKFATNQDTQLYVETILNGKDGKLDIGSQQQAITAGKSAKIIFTSDRAIDAAWDPTQLSKGLVSGGTVNIYGAKKTEKAVLKGNAIAGSNVLTFKGRLTGWKVGDKIALGGTGRTYNGKDADNSRMQDEVLTITEIKGNKVRFTNDNIKSGDNTVLRYDHKVSALAAAGELDLYGINLTRNVSFETENGKSVPISRRAHIMMMHTPNVSVSNAGFYDLGRSDKSKLVDDIGKNVDGSKGNGTNIRGRYALHLHQAGIGNGTAILRGNVVSGSPGWGIVQHESSAGLEDNVVFDVVGAGIVAESGNETGWWTDNLVMKSTGVNRRTAENQIKSRERRFDLGFRGDGFWVQGAGLIRSKDNKAISSNHTGMTLFGSALNVVDNHRPITTIQKKDLPAKLRKLLAKDQTEIDVRHLPMADVKGFESYNAALGLQVWGHKTNFDGELAFAGNGSKDEIGTAHEGRSLIKDIKLWHNQYAGIQVQYSSNIDVKDGLVLGRDDGRATSNGAGILSNHATYSSTYDNLTVKGFEEGARLERLNTDKDFIGIELKNSKFSNNSYNLTKVGDQPDIKGRPDDYSAFNKLRNNQFDRVQGNAAPTARFNSQLAGGLTVTLDASAAFDPDPLKPADRTSRKLASNGIAAYGWDTDNDGEIDSFGRRLSHTFTKAGRHTVGLTVLDSQGASDRTTQTIDVQPTAYENAFLNGDFGSAKTLKSWQSDSQWSDLGWYLTPNAQISQGAVDFSKPGAWSNTLGQVVRDEKVRKGSQTLSFSLKNIEGDPSRAWKRNEISLELWGINGQFQNQSQTDEGPASVGTLPMQRSRLVRDNFGGEKGEFFDWKDFSYDVNLGNGYDYLMVEIKGTRMDNHGDDVAIDNVALVGQLGPNKLVDSEADLNSTEPRPVAVLSFEADSSQLAKDTSTAGLDNSARRSRNIQPTEGKVGNAIALNGGGDRVTFKNSTDINRGTRSQQTLSMWFQVDQLTGDRQQVLFEQGNKFRGLNAYIEDDQLLVGGWDRKLSWDDSWISSNRVKAGQWHHLAVVLDAQEAVTADALTAYLDGTKIGQMAGAQLSQHAPLSLGNTSGSTRFEDSFGRHQRNGLAGAVDEVNVFDGALNNRQVRSLFSI